MITDIQRQQLAILDDARAMCEKVGIVSKVAGYGVLLLALPVYGDEKAEQLLLEATEPGQGKGRDEGRHGREGKGKGEIE